MGQTKKIRIVYREEYTTEYLSLNPTYYDTYEKADQRVRICLAEDRPDAELVSWEWVEE